MRFYFSSITCDDIQGGLRQIVRYEPYDKASLLAACQEIDGVIGPHAVVSLRFENSTLSIADNSDIFQSAPSLKYAEDVSFGAPTVGHFNALISSLTRTKSLVVGLDDDVISRVDWTILRHESAHELRRIKVCVVPNSPSEGAKRSIERLVRECTALPCTQDQDGIELDFKQSGFSGIFALRVIKVSTTNRNRYGRATI